MIYTQLFILILLILSSLSFDARSKSVDKDELTEFVKSFVQNNIEKPSESKLEISVPAIDPRLHIKPCLSKLNANIPEKHNGRNVNVKLVCEDKESWYLYIPVKVDITVPVLVTRNIMSKGSVIDNDNTEIEYRSVNSIRGESLNTINDVLGGRLKRRLSKGAVVSPRNLCLVCKGEVVTIIAKSSDFTIKTRGMALNDGSHGDQVRIKNSGSGRTINARVQSINEVVINL